MTTSNPYLSIIIPAHNEERRLPLALTKIDAYLKTQSYTAEVIVVENGSHDRTAVVTMELAKQYPYVRLMQVMTRGKGLAVKAGMLAATGDYRFICDTDLSMPIEELRKFLPPVLHGYDVMIGSREGPGAKRIGEPQYRHIMGRVNNVIIKLFAVREFEDTQCGFKMFTRQAAEDLFGVQQTTGIGFDVELIFVALRRRYKIAAVPITWYFDPDSKMRLIDDSLRMLWEVFEIRRNWRQGRYEPSSSQPNRQPEL